VARILLVEDDPDLAPVLEHMLLGAGYSVSMAHTVAAALDLLGAHSYALALTDLRLPDGTGLAIADRAKELGIDAVIVTGFAMQMKQEDRDRHEVLLKPLRRRELLEVVSRHIGPTQPQT
jgi:CheY-like chemotaxis protein